MKTSGVLQNCRPLSHLCLLLTYEYELSLCGVCSAAQQYIHRKGNWCAAIETERVLISRSNFQFKHVFVWSNKSKMCCLLTQTVKPTVTVNYSQRAATGLDWRQIPGLSYYPNLTQGGTWSWVSTLAQVQFTGDRCCKLASAKHYDTAVSVCLCVLYLSISNKQ